MQAGAHPVALDLHHKLLRIWNAIAGENLPANVKTALELQGRPAGWPRSPMPASSSTQREIIRQSLMAVWLVADWPRAAVDMRSRRELRQSV